MSRLYWTVQDSNGNAQTGVTVTVHDMADTLLATMADVGDGSYYTDTVATSQLVKIKENGTVKLSNYYHVCDDLVSESNLSRSLTPTGASLIGLSDDNSRWTAGDLQTLLDDEIASLSELASVAVNEGASLIGVRDAGGYYVQSDVEQILQEIGPRLALISGLTATASELNKLDGTNGSVTAVNLNSLVSGDTTILHQHDYQSWAGNSIGNYNNPDEDSGPLDFTVFSYNSAGSGPRGNIVLDVFDPDGSGRVVVYTGNDSDVGTHYDVITTKLLGDFNLTSQALFAGITTVTAAILKLANEVRSVQTTVGVNYALIDSGGATATASSGAAAADPRATTLYYETGGSYVKKRRVAMMQYPNMRTIELDAYFKADLAGASKVKLLVDSVESVFTVTATSFTRSTISLLLDSIKVDVPTERDIEIQIQGDGGGNGGYMSAWFQLRTTY